jgi:hypothetical protein
MKTLLVDDMGNPIVIKLNINPKKWQEEWVSDIQCNLITVDSGIKCIVGLNAFLPMLTVSAVNIETHEAIFGIKQMEYGNLTGNNWFHVLDVFSKELKKFGIKVNYAK